MTLARLTAVNARKSATGPTRSRLKVRPVACSNADAASSNDSLHAAGPPPSVHRRARPGRLADSVRIHRPGSCWGNHRRVQAGGRRPARLTHGPMPGNRGGRCRPSPEPYVGPWTPHLRTNRPNPDGDGAVTPVSDPCNTVSGRAGFGDLAYPVHEGHKRVLRDSVTNAVGEHEITIVQGSRPDRDAYVMIA